MTWVIGIAAYLLAGAGFAAVQLWHGPPGVRHDGYTLVWGTLVGVPIMACMALSRGLRDLLELPRR